MRLKQKVPEEDFKEDRDKVGRNEVNGRNVDKVKVNKEEMLDNHNGEGESVNSRVLRFAPQR